MVGHRHHHHIRSSLPAVITCQGPKESMQMSFMYVLDAELDNDQMGSIDITYFKPSKRYHMLGNI